MPESSLSAIAFSAGVSSPEGAGSSLEAGVDPELDGVLLDGVELPELEGVSSLLEQPARIAITMQRHRTTARIFFIVYLQKIFARFELFILGYRISSTPMQIQRSNMPFPH